MFPREHGAWSMLLQPFVAGLILFGPGGWMALATLGCMLGMFLLRQPLIVLGRQQFVWREQKPESSLARKWTVGIVAALLIGGILHFSVWPLPYLLAFGIGAAALTVLAVWLTIKNEQRSIWLQVISAAGPTAGAPAVALTATRGIPREAWILWACSALCCASGVLTVRALLEARIAAKRKMPLVPVFRTPAWISQFVLLGIGVGAFFFQSPWVGSALILMAVLHIFRTLGQLSNPELLQKSLTKVGLEAMAGSMVFSILVVIGLMRSTA
jgi:hypothetical protein